jgi:hypothetical protein
MILEANWKLEKASHVQRIRRTDRLVNPGSLARPDRPAASNPHPALVRTGGNFPSWQAVGAKGSGLIFLIPIVDRMVKMDLRVVTIHVAPLNLPLAPGRLETDRRNPAMKSPCSR